MHAVTGTAQGRASEAIFHTPLPPTTATLRKPSESHAQSPPGSPPPQGLWVDEEGRAAEQAGASRSRQEQPEVTRQRRAAVRGAGGSAPQHPSRSFGTHRPHTLAPDGSYLKT